jgi:uncharacterized protein (DUF169 family)
MDVIDGLLDIQYRMGHPEIHEGDTDDKEADMNLERLPRFLEALGLNEAPLGIFYTDTQPHEGFAPKPGPLPTAAREQKGEIDWPQVFNRFSCVIGNIWLARKKQSAAYFSAENFGCPGAAFWGGFLKPQTQTIINYVSTGIPGWTAGELYCESAEALQAVFEFVDPRPAPRAYCVIKPLEAFAAGETPELVAFFCRPESLCGLHQLAFFVTNDPEVVASPWTSACGSLLAWPQRYLGQGKQRAVIGGWDPSARKFYKTDELSFTVPLKMFEQILDRFDQSFLKTHTWTTVQKKILRSRRAWGEVRDK